MRNMSATAVRNSNSSDCLREKKPNKRVPITTEMRKNKKFKQQIEKEGRDWVAGLPDHLLELVIERLPLFDCFSFSSVCKPWKSITSRFFEKSSLVIPLLVKNGRDTNTTTRTCLNVLDRNSSFQIQFPKACRGCYVWGSFRDWLFLARVVVHSDILRISLFNPFSGDVIPLPEIYDNDQKMVMSSIPNDPKCICILLGKKDYDSVSIWTPGATKWRKIPLCHDGDVLYHEGNFYFLQKASKVVIISETSLLSTVDKNLITTRIYLEISVGQRDTMIYLLESCGDILLVSRCFYNEGLFKYRTSSFEIYRLNLSQRAWEKVESLVDQILFLGKYSSRSFSAKELGDEALAKYGNNRTWFMANELKWGYSASSFDHWLTAPIWWCLKERYSVKARARRTERINFT